MTVINQKAFTLIELLVVISVIAALAAVSINVIDGGRQKAIARDSTNTANLEKVCATIKGYYQGEDSYPEEGDNQNPLDSTAATNTIAKVYLSVWPQNFLYNYDVGTRQFSVHFQKETNTNYYKCGSLWRTVQECSVLTPAIDDVNDCTPLP